MEINCVVLEALFMKLLICFIVFTLRFEYNEGKNEGFAHKFSMTIILNCHIFLLHQLSYWGSLNTKKCPRL